MFGLGAQELLLLLIIGGLPALAFVALFFVTRRAKQNGRRDRSDRPDEDFDQ